MIRFVRPLHYSQFTSMRLDTVTLVHGYIFLDIYNTIYSAFVCIGLFI